MLVLLHVLQVKDWEPKISSIVDWWVTNEAAQAQQLQHPQQQVQHPACSKFVDC